MDFVVNTIPKVAAVLQQVTKYLPQAINIANQMYTLYTKAKGTNYRTQNYSTHFDKGRGRINKNSIGILPKAINPSGGYQIKTFGRKNSTTKVPTVNIKGKQKAGVVDNQKDTYWQSLAANNQARWTGKGWMLLVKKQRGRIKQAKTAAVKNAVGTPQGCAQAAQSGVTFINQNLASTQYGALGIGPTTMRKNNPIFVGRYQDKYGYIRQLPKGRRNMFDLSNKPGRLQYDCWMMANAWNKYANMFAQFQKDNSKTDGQIKNDFSWQLKKLQPGQAKTRQMVNFIRSTYYKLGQATYGITNMGSARQSALKAAKQNNYDSFLPIIKKIGQIMAAQTKINDPNATKRWMMANALINAQGRMIKNLQNKNIQQNNTVQSKLTAKNQVDSQKDELLKQKPAQQPYLRPSGFFISTSALRQSLNKYGNQANISIGDLYSIQNKNKPARSTGINSQIMQQSNFMQSNERQPQQEMAQQQDNFFQPNANFQQPQNKSFPMNGRIWQAIGENYRYQNDIYFQKSAKNNFDTFALANPELAKALKSGTTRDPEQLANFIVSASDKLPPGINNGNVVNYINKIINSAATYWS